MTSFKEMSDVIKTKNVHMVFRRRSIIPIRRTTQICKRKIHVKILKRQHRLHKFTILCHYNEYTFTINIRLIKLYCVLYLFTFNV